VPAVAEAGMGAKLVYFFPENAGKGIPTNLGMNMLPYERGSVPATVEVIRESSKPAGGRHDIVDQ
jgi:hypothetical protein